MMQTITWTYLLSLPRIYPHLEPVDHACVKMEIMASKIRQLNEKNVDILSVRYMKD